MCGFVLYIPTSKKDIFNKKKFIQSSKFIDHRGPDSENNHFSEFIKMIFFRLSIVDTSKLGNQPMFSYSKRFIIVFNGEIYNAKDLKTLLDPNKIIGNSDTEILINLYEKFGEKILKKLDGMFSFFIFDRKNNTSFFARDRFGIKPLYYSKNDDFIIISSEIKPILNYKRNNCFDKNALANFFIKQKMDHEDQTFFKDIFSVKPSTYGIIKNKKINFYEYWKIEDQNLKLNFSKAKEKYLDLFQDSIKKHLVSDRKIGLLFSAGTDSTMLAIIMKQSLNYSLDSYTYDFENSSIGDGEKSKQISKNLQIKNKLSIVDPEYVISNFDKICLELESPFTSIRLFGMRKALEAMKKDKFSVVFEGGGGDEILGGYNYNLLNFYLDKVKNKKLNTNFFLKKIIYDKKINILNCLMTISNQYGSTKDCTPYLNIDNFKKEFLDSQLNENFFFNDYYPNKINNLQKSQYIDIKYVNLPRSLKYTDRLSMNQNIENRVPFLDHHLAKFCFNLKNDFKIKDDETRFISKQSLKKFKNRFKFTKQKKAITDPQSNWMRNSLKEMIYDSFLSQDFRNLGLFNQKNIIDNYDYFLKNENQTSFNLFQIFSTYKFYCAFKKKFGIGEFN